jgi:hypothetical protein
MSGSWYLTSPWDPVPARRGDALGFSSAADYFADLIAPDLSNLTYDARWITLLSWSLKWSHIAWRAAGGHDLSTPNEQRMRYAWLRPLELLWLDRTLESGQTTGQLRGRRSIERWRKADRRQGNFAMNADQFSRYRQLGMYGAYRVLFRKLRELSTGDGWTLASTALDLAALLNESLPREARLKTEHFDGSQKWVHWAGNEARYWCQTGWPSSRTKANVGLLPTPNNLLGSRLPENERRLLQPLLFAPGTTRRISAEVLANAHGAGSHADLCDLLANSDRLAREIVSRSLAPLPAFSRFADAAMHAMRGIWAGINRAAGHQNPDMSDISNSAVVRDGLEKAREASSAWLRSSTQFSFQGHEVVSRLAKALQRASTPTEQLQAFTHHHREHGGGRRWFRAESGKMIPLLADTGIAASDYRFRLRPLIHLAAQCGIPNMRHALKCVARSDLEVVPTTEADDEEGNLL